MNHQVRVPRALTGSKSQLSVTARQEIAELTGNRPGRFLAELALAWAVIAAAIGLAVATKHWAVSLVAIAVVGWRQVVLGLLMHEQVHSLGLKGRWGDTLVNLFAVYPLLATTVEDYAEVHLRHHSSFMTDRDPDFIRKSGVDWTFPASVGKVLRLFGKDLTGLNTLKLVRGKTAPKDGLRYPRRHPTAKWVRPAYYAALATVFTVMGWWTEVLLYWVVPILTVTQVGVRWIAILEHEYGHEGASVAEVTPIVRLKWWERLLIPDLNFALHVYHHEHAAVSFSNLPKVHEIYRREGLIDESQVFDGAISYLKFIAGMQGRPGEVGKVQMGQG